MKHAMRLGLSFLVYEIGIGIVRIRRLPGDEILAGGKDKAML